MKKYLLPILLLGSGLFAQDVIQTKNGKSIVVVEGSIKVEPGNKKLRYKLASEPKAKKIKFKDIVSATYKEHYFRTVTIDGKVRGFFIMADLNGKQLGVNSRKRIVNKGGFDVPYQSIEMVVIEKDNSVSNYSVFTDVVNQKNNVLRGKAKTILIEQFSDCPNLIERLNTFAAADITVENLDIVKLFDNPYLTSCQ